MRHIAEPSKVVRHSCPYTLCESKLSGYLVHMKMGQSLADVQCHLATSAATNTQIFDRGRGGHGQPLRPPLVLVHALATALADWAGSHARSELPELQSAPSRNWCPLTAHTSPRPPWHQPPGAATGSRPPGTPAVRR